MRDDCDEGGAGDAEGLDVDGGEVDAFLEGGHVGSLRGRLSFPRWRTLGILGSRLGRCDIAWQRERRGWICFRGYA